jgi:4'-phosphopantetheinyl transferase
MNQRNHNNLPILHPVILPVSDEEQRLTGRAKVAALRRRARQAAALSARYGGWPLGAMEKDADGVPLPSNGMHWSLTHKTTFVAAVVAPAPVGIDLERIKPVSSGLYQHVADEREWALAPQKDLPVFFRYWTAKEAVLKAVRKGLAGLSKCRVVRIIDEDQLLLHYEQTPWTVVHYRFEPDHLATVTSTQVRIVWHRVEE